MKLGFIGLGKMGKNLVLRLLEKKHEVVVWNRSSGPVEEAAAAGAEGSDSPEDLVRKLSTPRIIWIMLPAGDIVDHILHLLMPRLEAGDMVIDGGNSYFPDTVRRAKMVSHKGVRYMDAGVSGGPDGAKNGACLMVGGDKGDFEMLKPLFADLAAPGAYAYVGSHGAGHFAKMVHNGIEYGMMQSIAEGAAILEKSPFHFNLAEVFRLYNSRSVIESRLVGWAGDAFMENPKLDTVSSRIGMLGEGEWTVKTAKEMGIDTPVLEQSVEVRKRSVTEPENFRNKVVTALRGKFGKHETKAK
jgi:6-phosphogluconate dehydrogenase